MRTHLRIVYIILWLGIVISNIVVLLEQRNQRQELTAKIYNMLNEERQEVSRVLLEYLSNRYALHPGVYRLRQFAYQTLAPRHEQRMTLLGAWTRIVEAPPIMSFNVPPFLSVTGIIALSVVMCILSIVFMSSILARILYVICLVVAVLLQLPSVAFQLRYAFFTQFHATMSLIFASSPIASYTLLTFVILVTLFALSEKRVAEPTQASGQLPEFRKPSIAANDEDVGKVNRNS